MIWFLLLFLHVNGLMAQTNQTASAITSLKHTIDMKTKPTMCVYIEPNSFYNGDSPVIQPDSIPSKCEVILFYHIIINNASRILVANTEVLKKLTDKGPVIAVVLRGFGYMDWSVVLTADGNDKDTSVLIKFAKENNLSGYHLHEINPQPPQQVLRPVMNLDVAKNIIPYVQKLKYTKEFIVGVSIGPYAMQIKNPCVNDFVEMNKVVDYYEINTISLNSCFPKRRNTLTPIKLVPHGNDYLLSLEEVTSFLKASKCDLRKVYYVAELLPLNNGGENTYDTYYPVCTANQTGQLCSWCIPSTKDCFDKGVFIKQQQFGMIIKFINCDDVENACGCGPFIGTRNILAGYNAESAISCAKIDAPQQCPP